MSKKKKMKKTELDENSPEFKQLYADNYCSPLIQAAHTYEALKHEKEDLEVENVAHALQTQNEALKVNDSTRMEQILMMQAQTLDLLFHKQIRRANNQEILSTFKAHYDLGLKAQRQCRSTIEALAEMKNPKPYIQNNRAQYQQVNNGVPEPRAHGENSKQSNELLEDKSNDGQWLDTGAPETASGNDKELEAVGAKHRAED